MMKAWTSVFVESDVQGSANSLELAKKVKTSRSDTGDVFVEAQVRMESDAKDSNMITRLDNFISET